MSGIGWAIGIAAFGALGNALFAYSQRKANVVEAPYAFVTMLVAVCLCLSLLTLPWIGRVSWGQAIPAHGGWAVAGDVGLYMTLLGFHLLFTRFGATYYALYAVMAILTTTLLVGRVLLREPINRFHLGAIMLALGAVLLFTLGQSRNVA